MLSEHGVPASAECQRLAIQVVFFLSILTAGTTARSARPTATLTTACWLAWEPETNTHKHHMYGGVA